MAELSKTAKASMIQETKKEVKIETEAEAIRQIRIDRLANLSILREDRIDKLLAAYDRDHAAVLHLTNSTSGLLKRAEAAEEAVIRLKTQLMECSWTGTLEEGKSYQVTRVHDEISIIEDARKEMQTFIPVLRKLVKNPEFLRGIEAEGYRINVDEINRTCEELGFDPIIEQMIEPKPPADLDFSHIDLAEIPAQAEDEHHMVDFGHDVTHPHPEGA